MARVGGMPLPTITDDSALGESVIQKSLRFRSGGSTYLNRTPSSAGNRKTWTWSAWIKRGTLGSKQRFFTADDNATYATYLILEFQSDDNLRALAGTEAAAGTLTKETAAVIRDTTNWYHLLFKFDASNTSAVWYINGEEITDLNSSTDPSNQDYQVNATSQHFLGRAGSSLDSDGAYFDGYMAEVNFVDGQALDASYFGFTDSQTGIWMPKRYEGSYGTNGFRLDFLDNSSAAALGIDKSPNGNDFTVNNHSVSASLTNDSMLDTPTNNFCVLNHGNKTTSFSGKDGGLTFDQTSNDQAITGTFFVTSGKWYWEFYKNSGHNPEIGIATVAETTLSQRSDGFIDGRAAFISNDGRIRTGSSSTANITGSSSGQTGAGWLRIACDMDNKKIWFSDLSGNYFNSGNPATGANPAYDFSSHSVADGWAPYICMTTSNTGNGYPNFGQFDLNNFSSNIPAGFKTLTAQNLRDELITSSQAINPSEHFAATTYTGAQSSTNITGLKFKPDLIWMKSRTQLYNHYLFDSVRGFGSKHLIPNSDAAEGPSESDTTALGGTRSSGFFISSASGISDTYQAPNNYIAWCWKAGGAAVTNNDGTITTSVSVNEEAGFSIISYSGTGSAGTIGHGLGKVPKWIITKRRTGTEDWKVYSPFIDGGKFLKLNSTQDQTSNSNVYPNTAPTSTVYSVGSHPSVTENGDTYIAYCWAEIPGYSKFGKYKGNGNANGPYVHLGFRPALLITRRIDSGDHWIIRDSARNTDNQVYSILNPNSNAVEFGSRGHVQNVDFLANGFKITGSDSGQNGSTGTYIFIAFAEQPAISSFTTMTNAR